MLLPWSHEGEPNSQQQALPSCKQIDLFPSLFTTLPRSSCLELLFFPDFFEEQKKSEFHMATSEVSGLDELLVNKL